MSVVAVSLKKKTDLLVAEVQALADKLLSRAPLSLRERKKLLNRPLEAELERAFQNEIYFFFRAEDGIRDGRVTGVQTCALPISGPPGRAGSSRSTSRRDPIPSWRR